MIVSVVGVTVELNGLAGALTVVVAVGAALGIAWPITHSKAVQQRQKLLAETNATLQDALNVERAERHADNERHQQAIATLRTDCARETAALAGKVEVLTGTFAAQLASAVADRIAEAVATAIGKAGISGRREAT